MNHIAFKYILEAAVLSSDEPLSLDEISKLGDGEYSRAQLNQLLLELQAEWAGKGVELIESGSGWHFCTRADIQPYLDRIQLRSQPKYSRAVMETLAIIAYKQPVTRGEIEQVRGVTVSSQIINTLENRGWIKVVGHKDAPGRPQLLATTRQFLDDLKLKSLDSLPPLPDMSSLTASHTEPESDHEH